MKHLLTAAAAAVLFLQCACASQAGFVSYSSGNGDALVVHYPAGNAGGIPTPAADVVDYQTATQIWPGANPEGITHRPVLHFPLAGYLGQPTSATLSLYQFGVNAVSDFHPFAYLQHVNATRGADVTVSDVDPAALETIGTYTGSRAPGFLTFDVTAAVAADLAAGRPYSVFVLGQESYEWATVSFASSENDSQLRPRLTLEPVPEPSALLALGSGLAGLLAIRRRK